MNATIPHHHAPRRHPGSRRSSSRRRRSCSSASASRRRSGRSRLRADGAAPVPPRDPDRARRADRTKTQGRSPTRSATTADSWSASWASSRRKAWSSAAATPTTAAGTSSPSRPKARNAASRLRALAREVEDDFLSPLDGEGAGGAARTAPPPGGEARAALRADAAGRCRSATPAGAVENAAVPRRPGPVVSRLVLPWP